MKLLLSPNKNESPAPDSCDLVEVGGGMRIVHALIPIDLFLDDNREIYDRLRKGEEVEIEIKEIKGQD